MALIPELEALIAKGSPEVRGVLTKAANKMSEDQQRGFLASLQLGDAEFQTSVAPYMPKGSTIDPSRARLRTYGPGVADEYGINIKGAANPHSKPVALPPLKKDGVEYEMVFEPNTVNVIEGMNANPRIWAHEYRHLEGSDAGPKARRFNRSHREVVNRVQDLLASQNKQDLAENVRSIAESLIAPLRAQMRFTELIESDSEDYERYMAIRRATTDATEEELVEYANSLLEEEPLRRVLLKNPKLSSSNPYNFGMYFQEHLPDMARGKYFREDTRPWWQQLTGKGEKPLSIELPRNFRKGGRTRLI